MTWVIGATFPLGGYGLLVSDVQVTLQNGTRLDVIRKIHDVGPVLVMGFAGSVRIGFEMVESLRSALAVPQDEEEGAFIPVDVAEAWAPVAAHVFAHAAAEERALGCHLLLVGVHPTEDVIPGRARAYVVRMASPSFRPGFAPQRMFSVLSIGSGAQVREYRGFTRELLGRPNQGVLQAAIGPFERWGQTVAQMLGMGIGLHPAPGVSPHLHFAQVRRWESHLFANDRRTFQPEGPPVEFLMPAVASTYPEFCEMLAERGIAGARARC